jgi:glycosyltransferase involved in cell wall biosynthesis
MKINMKIATILPYKENYTNIGPGAVSLWVNDFLKYSKFKNKITIFGNTNNKNYLSKNYKNIKIDKINSRIFSSTNEYTNKLINHLNKEKYDLVELHNRPIMLNKIKNKINSKIIFYFHNDPLTMKGSKTVNERLLLLKNVDKVVFISEWVKKKFFENLDFKSHIKAEIIYHSINPLKKLNKKKKQIIFVGKLNYAKGYDLFCDAVNEVLDQYPDWTACSIGDEKRFLDYRIHTNHLNLALLPNKITLKRFEESEIAIVPSRWDEPFGRTALEASSRGCATIISKNGGLTEATDHAIVLKKLDANNLKTEIVKLIKNNKLRKKFQINGLKNVKHKLNINSKKIDFMRLSIFPFSYFNTNNKKLRILNIYNLGRKLNHRIYNLSMGKKFTNGFIRNEHDVLEISDRDFVKQNRLLSSFDFKDKFHGYLVKTAKNYNPDFIIFGHTDNVNEEILNDIRNINNRVVISQWNEDPLMDNFNGFNDNINKVKKFLPYVDNTYLTTDPNQTIFKSKNYNNINFLITPVDKGIECFNVFNLKPKNDFFYAISHGVNRGYLKKGKVDSRVFFINKLRNKIKDIKYDFYGFDKKEPIWGNEFYRALTNSKMALNLSRGTPTKHYSSNRIASLMGNGLLTFIDYKVCMDSFFDKNEIIFYKNIDDLADKIKYYSSNDKIRIKIAKNGKKKYFQRFNEVKTTKYIVDTSFGKNNNLYS